MESMVSERCASAQEGRTMTDRELLLRYAAGSPEAFDELMKRYSDMVFSTCLRILNDPDAHPTTFFSLPYQRPGPFRSCRRPSTRVCSRWVKIVCRKRR